MFRCSASVLFLAVFSALKAEDDSFHVTTTVVQLQAEVTDRSGKHVANLSAPDFGITIDGQPQVIVGCTYVALDGQSSAALRASGSATSRNDTNPHTTIFVLDDLHMSPQDVPFVRKALREYVDHQMQAGESAAIWQVDRPNGVYQTLTSNRSILRQAIDNLTWNSHADTLLAAFTDPTGEDERIARNASSPDAAYQHSRQSELDSKIAGLNHTPGSDEAKWRLQAGQAGDAVAVLDSLIQQLQPLSGRKAIVFFADGLGAVSAGVQAPLSASPEVDRLGQRFRTLVDHASRSQAVLYTIDSRGLQYRQPEDILSLWVSQTPMETLADETGGFFSGDTNDLTGVLRRIREDQRSYYLLAFKAPERLNRESAPQKIDFFRVRVKALQSNLHVRTAAGFWSYTDGALRDGSDRHQIWNPQFSPIDGGDIHVRVTPLYGRIADKQNIRVFVFADTSKPSATKDANGRQSKNIELSIAVWGPGNHIVTTFDRNVQIASRNLDSAVVRMIDVPISKWGPYQVRAVVRDLTAPNRRTGSAVAVLDVPQPVHHAVALTTPMIRPSPAGHTDFDEWIAKREFYDGQDLTISTGLEDWNGCSERTECEGKFRVLFDDREVVSRSLPIVKSRNGKVGLITRLALDKSFSPGEYHLEFEALQGHRVLAQTRTDFLVLPNPSSPSSLQ